MMVRPCEFWPTEKLAHPREHNAGSILLFDTPIGLLSQSAASRRTLGLLVLEEMRGIYEKPPVEVHPGDIVLDLGANVGTFSRFAFMRGASHVIAFEPEPSHIECIERAFASEIREGRMTIVRAAAWHESTKLRFETSGLTSQLTPNGRLEVNTVTIDEIVMRLGLPRVNFIKADIEGAERHALKGAVNTIRDFAPQMALCIYHFPDDPTIIPEIVRQIRPYSVKTNAGNSQAFFDPA
jgi:FkbM family methyltransferase